MNETHKPKYSSLANKKSYTTPVWWIGFIILVELCFSIASIFTLRKAMEVRSMFGEEQMRRVYLTNLISFGIIVVVLLAEAITYWKIRKRITRKSFVWGHIGGLLLAFIIVPLLYTVSVALISANSIPDDFTRRMSIAGNIRIGLFWTLLVVAHICFVRVLIDAFKKRGEEPDPPTSDSPDILNDYA